MTTSQVMSSISSEDEGVSEARGSSPSRPERSELVARRAKVRLMDSMAESSRRDSWLMSEPLALRASKKTLTKGLSFNYAISLKAKWVSVNPGQVPWRQSKVMPSSSALLIICFYFLRSKSAAPKVSRTNLR